MKQALLGNNLKPKCFKRNEKLLLVPIDSLQQTEITLKEDFLYPMIIASNIAVKTSVFLFSMLKCAAIIMDFNWNWYSIVNSD